VSNCCLTLSNFSAISRREQVTFWRDDDDVCFAPHQNTQMDFYSASSLKQQSADRNITPLGQIILIIFVLTPYCCMLSGETANTIFIVFGLILPGLDPKIYCTHDGHAKNCTTNAINTA